MEAAGNLARQVLKSASLAVRGTVAVRRRRLAQFMVEAMVMPLDTRWDTVEDAFARYREAESRSSKEIDSPGDGPAPSRLCDCSESSKATDCADGRPSRMASAARAVPARQMPLRQVTSTRSPACARRWASRRAWSASARLRGIQASGQRMRRRGH